MEDGEYVSEINVCLTFVLGAWRLLLVGGRPPPAVPGCWAGVGGAWPGPG